MDGVLPRLERDVERLREEVRSVHAVAMRAETEIEAHKDSCVEASRRTYEKVEAVDKKVDRVDAKMDEVKRELSQRRLEDAQERRERQELVDATTEEWRADIARRLRASEGWNRRIGLAVVVSAIAIVGAVVGTGAKPFITPAVEAIRALR